MNLDYCKSHTLLEEYKDTITEKNYYKNNLYLLTYSSFHWILVFEFPTMTDTEGVPSHFVIETIMEHIAKTLNKDPTEIRKLNLYQEGQVI